MTWASQIWSVARSEAAFFARFPRLLAAAGLVALLPAFYALIYLASVWDPASNTGSLPVALVNLDKGVEYREHVFNVGFEVASELRQKKPFGFQDFSDEQEARRLVREGKLAFALIIPPDFSSNAVPGQQEGAGKLVIYTSEGNNFESALIAKTFARELGHDVNETLNERRWKLVLSKAAGSQHGVDQLHQGMQQLRDGAHELSKGATQIDSGAHQSAKGSARLASAVGQLTGGVKQLGAGLRTMDASRPRGQDLTRLQSGAEALAAGQAELGAGLGELQSGTKKMRDELAAYRVEAGGSLFTSTRVSDGLDQLLNGVTQLDNGLGSAVEGQRKLAEGADKLSIGVSALATGVRSMNTGLRSMVTKLPEDSQLDELGSGAQTLASGDAALADGTQKLKAGTVRLEAGLDLITRSLPSTIDGPGGSAQGLANSVKPMLEVAAAVPNSGSAFAANLIPAALWLGASVAAFLINVRVLPRQAKRFSRPAQLLGKIAIPAMIVVAQTLLIYAALHWVLAIHVAMPLQFELCLVLSALTFLSIVMALTRALGDAGKAISMIFLAVQLSSSGGILPVELSGSVFAAISPWLPITWVVRAIKATLFGAYDGAWLGPAALVGLAACVALCLATWIGRWRYVKSSTVRPAVDF
jgi:putative membrane protein